MYCSLLISSQYVFNMLIASVARLIADWRYMQLAGSLVTSFAIGYPWLITESFKWLCVRGDYVRVERVCKRIFKDNGVISRLVRLRTGVDEPAIIPSSPDDTLDSASAVGAYWPMMIWQPTFRKIICYFVLMWSVLSLTYFFINEEDTRLTPSHMGNYMIHNFLLAFSNTMLGVIYYKFGAFNFNSL